MLFGKEKVSSVKAKEITAGRWELEDGRKLPASDFPLPALTINRKGGHEGDEPK